MSADATRIRALQSLLGATPAPIGEIPTLAHVTSLTPEEEDAQYRVDLAKLTGRPIDLGQAEVAASTPIVHPKPVDLGEVAGTYSPIPGREAPTLATSVPVGEPDLSRVPGGGASVPGAVTHAMTGAGLPQMPAPAATPAPREFQSLAGAAPQNSGIPAAVRAYVAQQSQAPSREEQELADAQEQQRLLQLYEGLGHAGATVGAALGHIKVDEGFWHDLSRQTGRPVEELKQLQAVRQIQAAKDPASEENQRARAVYAQLLPEVAQRPGWNSVTKEDIPAFLTDARFRQQAAAREQTQAKAQAMDEARLAETKRHNLVAETKPVDTSKADRNEAYALRAKIAKEKWEAEQAQLGNMPLGDGRVVKFSNPLAHTTKEAQAFRDQAATTYALNKQLDRLEDLVRSVPPGSKVVPSEAQAAIQAARSGVIAMTNKALGLGAITQGHQELLMSTIQDPTKLINAFNPGRVLAGIEDMRQNGEMNLQGRAKTLGGRIITMGEGGGGQSDVAAGATSPASVDPEDAAALDWARSHPHDPRSRRILDLVGMPNA